MQSLYDIPAPAKLNLFLHITGRRADGYHLLQSVFMLIDWCDTLHFELRRDGQISREDLSWPLPTDDLVVRAARALHLCGLTRPLRARPALEPLVKRWIDNYCGDIIVSGDDIPTLGWDGLHLCEHFGHEVR